MRFIVFLPALLCGIILSTGCGEEKKTKLKRPGKGATSDPASTDGLAAAVLVDCAQITPQHKVSIHDRKLSRSPLPIETGETVLWENLDSLPHTVTNGVYNDEEAGTLFDSGELRQGQQACVQFNKPGYYHYFCSHHGEEGDRGGVDVIAADLQR